MLHRTICNIMRRTACTNIQISYALKSVLNLNTKRYNLFLNCSYPQQNLNSMLFVRFKSKGNISRKSKSKDEESDEDEEFDIDVDDYLNTDKSKVIVITVPSLRLDAIAKAGFGISRNKLDKDFYNSNLRVNGKKCFKKGMMMHVGDEIDVIQRQSPTNPNFLIINRCTLQGVNANPETDSIKVKLIQNKSLLVENYKDKWDNKE
ncbi:mitochondrial transcription rescue factor 1 isoform X1 [Bombus bifarius]|uniref:Mitochondrial transcription rescue factor 1 isoform X1 n=1 Tax=Bombus bifarius TaxID=103933 RepID=A0A6P8N7N2_9HYME|nr:mitochondrial transcription rescue factor 1 isoform X1 [Bombus bifarius]